MTTPRLLIDYETAKELAESVLRHENPMLEGDDHYVIVDSQSGQHPWGWSFSPVVEPYWSTKTACPYDSEWQITIDRFSGKVTIIGRSDIENDHFQISELTLHAIGQNSTDVIMFFRQLFGWSANEAERKLSELPMVVLLGPMISLRSIHETLTNRGAATTLTIKHA